MQPASLEKLPADLEKPPADTERTYSLDEAARIICGDDTPNSQTWLLKRLRGAAHPHLTGYKAGRRWRMTHTDLTNAINQLRPRPGGLPTAPPMTSMTMRSRRRLAG